MLDKIVCSSKYCSPVCYCLRSFQLSSVIARYRAILNKLSERSITIAHNGGRRPIAAARLRTRRRAQCWNWTRAFDLPRRTNGEEWKRPFWILVEFDIFINTFCRSLLNRFSLLIFDSASNGSPQYLPDRSFFKQVSFYTRCLSDYLSAPEAIGILCFVPCLKLAITNPTGLSDTVG